jgi:hypothetical protein
MPDRSNEEQEIGIAIWGPVGSGKDWLIRAFAKELDYFNRTIPDFLFELTDEDGNPINPTTPSKDVILPTAEAEDYFLKFTRRPKLENPDHSHLISAHSHSINIQNDKGGNLMAVLDNPEGHEYTYQTLIDSRYIIVVLDPTYISYKPILDEKQIKDRQSSSIVEKESFTQSEYKAAIQDLFAIFSKETSKKRYLAFCLTKMDKKSVRGSSWDLLRRLFGLEMYDLLLKHKRTYEIEVFSTSAAGFLRNPGTIGARLSNEDRGSIKDENNWNPVNTATPFFWIFENKEKEKLKNSGFLKEYIEYPTRSS